MRAAAAYALAAALCCGGAFGDSLFRANDGNTVSLISKDERVQAGDVVTVLIRETIDSSVSSDTNTKKESDVSSEAQEAKNPFLIAEGEGGLNIISKKQLPNWEIEAENETKTRGATRRATELNTSMSCLVTQVLPNGLIAIEGEKTVTVNREDSQLRVTGIVRIRDITPSNTIASNQIANARIELRGRGPLWNNQRRGLVTRVLDWFSPF